MSETLDGPRFGPASGGQASGLVILLHGVGADGADLIGLAPHFATALPDVAFVAPNAPFPCDMAPFGYQWFSIGTENPEYRLAEIRHAAEIIDGFIDAELERHRLDAGHLALVGFSQGTMMSLFTAPRRAAPCAGVLGYSGRLESPDLLLTETLSRPPVVLVHGEEDPIVPFDRMAHAEAGLRAASFEVETHARPGLAHGIDEAGVAIGSDFLKRVLGAA